MKFLIVLFSSLLMFSANAGKWNPSIKDANKIAKRVIEERDVNYLRDLVNKKNLNPDFLFYDNFVSDVGNGNSTLGTYASKFIFRSGDGPDHAYRIELIKVLYTSLGANINNVIRGTFWGDETPLSVAKYRGLIELLFKLGADYDVALKDQRGEPRTALSVRFTDGGVPGAERFKYLVEFGAKPSKREENCESFQAIDGFLNESNQREEVRVIFRDFYMKKFNVSKEEFFKCVDKGAFPVCATLPQICEDSYSDLMKE